MVLAVLWAPQLEHFPSLWQYLQSALAYSVPPVVALFLVGMFWRGANATGAGATLLIGSICGGGLFLSNEIYHLSDLHFLYAAPLLLAIDAAILIRRQPSAARCGDDHSRRGDLDPGLLPRGKRAPRRRTGLAQLPGAGDRPAGANRGSRNPVPLEQYEFRFDRVITLARLAGEGGEWNEPGEGGCAG